MPRRTLPLPRQPPRRQRSRHDALPRAGRARRRRPLRGADRGASRDGGALRGEGQPRPTAARRAGRGRLPLRRGQPGRGARGDQRGWARGRRRLLQPGQAPRPHRRGRGPRGAPVRRGLDAGGPQGRRGRPGHGRPVPPGHLRRRLGLAALPQVRLLGRRGRRGAHPGGVPRPRSRRGLLPRGVTATRPGGLGQADRRRGTRVRAAATPRPAAEAAGHGRRLPGGVRRALPVRPGRTARPSRATSTVPSATRSPRRSSSPAAASSATPGLSCPRSSA